MAILSKILKSESKPIEKKINEIPPDKKSTFSEHPRICLIDLDKDSKDKLKELSLNVQLGTFGQKIKMSYQHDSDCFKCALNYQIPPNLHEYDILVVDLNEREALEYKSQNYQSFVESQSDEQYLVTCYPIEIFNPLPLTAHFILNDVCSILDHGGLVIVFIDEQEMYEYHSVRKEIGGRPYTSESRHTNYEFLPIQLPIRSKYGKEIAILEDTIFLELLKQFSGDFYYRAVFTHIFDYEKRKPAENFTPLLNNSHEEIISFYYEVRNGAIIAFPQMENKAEFLRKLLTHILPQIKPTLFPQSTLASWRSREDYQLPREQDLIQRKYALIQETEAKILQIDNEIQRNKEKYSCLHEILIETNDNLVDTVKKYLEWLGFSHVKKTDLDGSRILEEDLQFEYNGKTILVEVKGIGRTSKDEECSQIDKIVLRRIRETKNTAIHGVYIVNHQKHLPPLDRQNPPFTEHQISDAIDNSRSMMTTWQLFNLYFSIKNGAITKEEGKDIFLKTGLVEFTPANIISLGKPKNVLKDGKVILLVLSTKIQKEGHLFLKRNDRFYRVNICEMMVDDKKVDFADSCGVGIEIDASAKNSDEFYYRVLS